MGGWTRCWTTRRVQRLDLRLAADANLAALAPWAELPQLNGPVAGALHVDAAVTGSISTPEAVLTVTGRDISAAGLQGVTVQAAGRVGGDSGRAVHVHRARRRRHDHRARSGVSRRRYRERSVWTGVSSISRR